MTSTQVLNLSATQAAPFVRAMAATAYQAAQELKPHQKADVLIGIAHAARDADPNIAEQAASAADAILSAEAAQRLLWESLSQDRAS